MSELFRTDCYTDVNDHLCEKVKLAFARHERDLERTDLIFDEEEAARAIRFIERLSHWKEPFSGRPIVLQNWQRFLVSQIFGWKRIDETTGQQVRRFRETFISVSRKNGKSLFVVVGDF